MIPTIESLAPAVPDWALALILPSLAIASALIVHATVFKILCSFAHRWHTIVNALVRNTAGISRYGLVLFALSAIMPAMPLDPRARDIVHKVFVAAVVLLIGWVAMLAAKIAADYYMGRFQLDSSDNVLARKAVTQVAVLKRVIEIIIFIMTIGAALMTFDTVREFGVSLFASAGVAGLVAGLAARPVFANLFAGLQLAITQPIRLGDAVLVENEFGHVEEINSSYVVIRIWDLRRMVVPLSYFMEKPFQNWSRTSSRLLGAVMLYTDFSTPVGRVRQKAVEIVRASRLWDKNVFNVQVTDATEYAVQLRVLFSARNAGDRFDLGCEIREKLIGFLQGEYPDALPRRRNEAAVRANGESPGEKPVGAANTIHLGTS